MTTKGYVVKEWSVFCGKCADWDRASNYDNQRAAAKYRWKKLGWTNTRNEGWLCPRCVKEKKDE